MGSFIFFTFDVDGSSHELGEFAGDGQAQSASAVPPCKAFVLLCKFIVHFLQHIGIDSDSGIITFDFDHNIVVFFFHNAHADFDAAGVGEF